MKKTFLLLFLSAGLCFSFAPEKNLIRAESNVTTAETLTTIKWETQDMDLGTIKHQVPKTVEFAFTNSGKVPLIITEVKTSCGCTVAEYPKEPIAPAV